MLGGRCLHVPVPLGNIQAPALTVLPDGSKTFMIKLIFNVELHLDKKGKETLQFYISHE